MSLLDELPHKCTIFRLTPQPDGVGGSQYVVTIEQEGVECWEQKLAATEIQAYEKRGINVQNKIFFVQDPKVDERHCILITERFGVAQPNLDVTDVQNPDTLDVKTIAYPDASAGCGILWCVMCASNTGSTE